MSESSSAITQKKLVVVISTKYCIEIDFLSSTWSFQENENAIISISSFMLVSEET